MSIKPCEKYFSESKESFWEKLVPFLKDTQKNNYVHSTSNQVIVSCINFFNLNNKDFSKLFEKSLQSREYYSIIFKNCNFMENIDISSIESPCKNIEFENCIFEKDANLSYNRATNISIRKCIFKNDFRLIEIDTSKNNKSLTIQNSTFKTLFSMENCLLENTKLSNLDFTLTKVEFKNTIFEDTKLNNIKWGKFISADRDIFRQIKVVMDKQKNHIDFNFFHSLELEEYRKELKNYKWYQNIEDKIIFNLNRWSSNFSQSWIQPLILLILFSALTYSGLCYSNNLEECCINNFFQFFNPLNKKVIDDFENIYAIWFLHKIISIFFVYHIIIALRRKTK